MQGTPGLVSRSAMSTPPVTVASTRPITSNFENLWAKALADYKEKTGRNFHQDQITQFSACRSLNDVIQVLETQSKGLEAFRKKGKNIRNVLKPFVHLVGLFNDTAAEVADAVNVPGGKAIFVAIGFLLAAAKGVTEVYDTLEDLSQELEGALNRVGLYLGSNLGLSDIAIQIKPNKKKGLFGTNINVLGQRAKDYVGTLSGNKEVQEALQRLDKLTKKEELLRIAEIHKKVDQIDKLHMDDKIRKWLSPPTVSQYHDTVYKAHQGGTGDWFFKPNSKFSQWKQAKNSILWIYGKPGSGKSVLW
ncbi:hypothetical protein GYMLUDRAFT_707482 [Collybiopsis luxurians FD-317 M1]|uniref:Unplaced genomic scaffold GYMLUscaffold_39, whole genome shotgun sequence n=1 Tax=Collybiopsis luxurians FD-317 M1 TaxID=944289 RepID=A0A0D0B4C9_9AGAR|nr:hypothetical protein GYMLUDRAFT_707482 [Collybiopsis luxurians FD-317 M1]